MTLSRQKILVIDDMPAIVALIKEYLSAEYEVVSASTGKLAVQMASTPVYPAIILLDVKLPDMDGYAVCRQLKLNDKTKNIPVIFLTVFDDPEEEVMAFDCGAMDYLTKPFNPLILMKRIKTQLELAMYRQNLEAMVEEKTSEIQQTRLAIIQKLSRAAEYRDNETGMHIIRMSKYCEEIGLAYGLTNSETNILLQASPMHDIGKIGIPDSILLKPGALDKDEWELMKKHCEIGCGIIGEHDSELLKSAAIIAFEHHERWDGKGYPSAMKGTQIHLYGRIASVADVFDALTSRRPYKEPWPVDKAIDTIAAEKEKQFDPDVIEAFLKAVNSIKMIKTEFSD